MNTVQRTKGIRRAVRAGILNKPALNFVTAGSGACGRMMLEAFRRKTPGPSDSAILTWARFDLEREILGGFWQKQSA